MRENVEKLHEHVCRSFHYLMACSNAGDLPDEVLMRVARLLTEIQTELTADRTTLSRHTTHWPPENDAQ